MKTLVIFDSTGKIFYQASGDVVEPQGGIQFLWVEIPEGKYLSGIDMSGEEPKAILMYKPKSETDKLKDKVSLQDSAIMELAELVSTLTGEV